MFFSGAADVRRVGENVTLFFPNDLNNSAMDPQENIQLLARSLAVGCYTALYWKMSSKRQARRLKERLECPQKQSVNKGIISDSQALSELIVK